MVDVDVILNQLHIMLMIIQHGEHYVHQLKQDIHLQVGRMNLLL